MTLDAIRCRAPLRLGFAGGGTDLSPFCDEFGGAVLNCTIDRYAYAFVSSRDDGKAVFRARDINVEEVHEAGNLLPIDSGLRLHRCVYNHFLKEDATQAAGLRKGVTVATVVDAPPGSGLGSSSALVVALCEALRTYVGVPLGLYDLARLAFEIERSRLALAGGRQDQYAAAFGGMNFIEFLPGDVVVVNPLRLDQAILNELEASLLTCFVGTSRESARIITQQTTNIEKHDPVALEALVELKQAAFDMKRAILIGDIPAVGAIMSRAWNSKKRTAPDISSSSIDKLFRVGIDAGASSGKISGAGGGGFLMFTVPPEDRREVIAALNESGGHASPVHLTSKGVETWRDPALKIA